LSGRCGAAIRPREADYLPRDTNRKLIDIANAVVDGHGLLPKSHGAP
jgi:hypothetical protein